MYTLNDYDKAIETTTKGFYLLKEHGSVQVLANILKQSYEEKELEELMQLLTAKQK